MYWRFLCLVMFIVFVVATSSWAGAQEGLIGYWNMNAGSGDKVADASGNGHDGTAKNAKWVDGKIGKALEFNGADSIVDIPYFPEITPKEGATLAAWVFPTDKTRSCIVGQFEGYGVALFTDLQLKSVIWGDDWVITTTIPQNEWSHVAMTWDVKNSERMIFLNGKTVEKKGGAQPVPQVQNDLGIGLWIGWPAGWGDDSFMGIIDEVKMWNRVLGEDEINQASMSAPVEPQGKLATVWGNVKAGN